jgi:hypothetical protein
MLKTVKRDGNFQPVDKRRDESAAIIPGPDKGDRSGNATEH